jgi:fructuronate reductase
LEAGGDAAEFAYVVALWIATIHKRGDLNDPRRDEILAAAKVVDAPDPSATFFAVEGLFSPELVQNRAWRDLVNRELAILSA